MAIILKYSELKEQIINIVGHKIFNFESFFELDISKIENKELVTKNIATKTLSVFAVINIGLRISLLIIKKTKEGSPYIILKICSLFKSDFFFKYNKTIKYIAIYMTITSRPFFPRQN